MSEILPQQFPSPSESPKRRGRPPKSQSPSPNVVQFKSAPIEPRHRNIAIVGCYPESWELAPFADKDWEIWGFSRKHMNKLPRCDKWFELHAPEKLPIYERSLPGYLHFIKSNQATITADVFDRDALVREFGPYFFKGGQLPWMLAYAITLNPKKIGIWGFSAPEDKANIDFGYCRQRYEAQYFISIMKFRGIEPVVPGNCDLLEPGKLYD